VKENRHTYSFQPLDIFAGFKINLADPVKYYADEHDGHQEDGINYAGDYQRT